MNEILLLAGIVIICILVHRLTFRLGVPSLLAFLALGMCFGVDGILHISFNNYRISEVICSISLIFIMFYGGFGTNFQEARSVAVKSTLLSTLGVLFTAGLVGVFAHFILRLPWAESMLIGSVISSTDAASVFSILRSKKLNLKDHTASMLEMESGSNDPMSYMLTLLSVISSTDAASVFSILRSKKLNLKDHTASMLEMESGSNDPMSYMLTLLWITILTGDQVSVPLLVLRQLAIGGILGLLLGKGAVFVLNRCNFYIDQGNTIFLLAVSALAYALPSQLAIGGILGLLLGKGAVFVLNRCNFYIDQGNTIFLLAVSALAYALPSALGGNGYLSVYLCGIVMGNSYLPHKRDLVLTFDVLTGIAQMVIFFLLGLLVTPSQLPAVFLPSVLIMAFLTLVARPLSVTAVLAPFRSSKEQIGLVSWSGLRGAASIVFAIQAVLSGAPMEYNLFNLVFCIVLLSISLQGTLLAPMAHKLNMIDEKADVRRTFNDPMEYNLFNLVFCIVLLSISLQGTLLAPMAHKLNMIDEKADVRRTFNDYQAESDITFSKISIGPTHPWVGHPLRDIPLPPELLVTLILRNDVSLVPNGSTVLLAGDLLVLAGHEFEDRENLTLYEVSIDKTHKWKGKSLRELSLPKGTLIIMIQNQNGTVIPDGNTIIHGEDTLVIARF